MKQKYEEILVNVREKEKFNPHEYLNELEYLDKNNYLDVWVLDEARRNENPTLSEGGLIEVVEENSQYELNFENIDLKPAANQILLEKDRNSFRNKILICSALLSALISLVVAYLTSVYWSVA